MARLWGKNNSSRHSSCLTDVIDFNDVQSGGGGGHHQENSYDAERSMDETEDSVGIRKMGV